MLSDSSSALLLLPGALLVYYLLAWLFAGREPQSSPVVAQYAPPENMPPAEARYLYCGKSDHKTVACVLAHFASQKIITIQPENNSYRITRLVEELPPTFPEEEAAAFRAMLEVETFKNPADKNHALHPKSFLLSPGNNDNKISLILSVITGSLSKRIEGKYFDRNRRYSAPAIFFSVAAALLAANNFHTDGVVFLTFWFLICGLMLSMLFMMYITPALRDMLHGRMNPRYLALFLVPVLFCTAMYFVGLRIALASSPVFLFTLILLLALNAGFASLLSKMTPLGCKSLDQLLGFRDFLSTVELDQYNRVNDPHLTPALINDYLAFAIALDLKDPWGDHLSSALFATATSSSN